jgi:hypothetical protein
MYYKSPVYTLLSLFTPNRFKLFEIVEPDYRSQNRIQRNRHPGDWWNHKNISEKNLP